MRYFALISFCMNEMRSVFSVARPVFFWLCSVALPFRNCSRRFAVRYSIALLFRVSLLCRSAVSLFCCFAALPVHGSCHFAVRCSVIPQLLPLPPPFTVDSTANTIPFTKIEKFRQIAMRTLHNLGLMRYFGRLFFSPPVFPVYNRRAPGPESAEVPDAFSVFR